MTAVILLAGHTHGAGLCNNSPNKQVCYSIVYQRTDPHEATVAAVHKLVDQTKVAKVVAQRQTNSSEIAKCITLFDGAIINCKLLRKQYKTKIIFSFKNRCTTQPWILNRIKLHTSLSNPSMLPPKVFTSLSLFLFEFSEDCSITQ